MGENGPTTFLDLVAQAKMLKPQSCGRPGENTFDHNLVIVNITAENITLKFTRTTQK